MLGLHPDTTFKKPVRPITQVKPNTPSPFNQKPVQPKCFKCQQLGHLANQCPKQNFPIPSQKHDPPIRNNNVSVETSDT